MWGRGFQICGYFWPPTLRSRDTAHAQYDFWPKHVLMNNAYGIYIVDRAKQYCKHLIFGMLLNIVKPEQQKYKFSLSGLWPTSRDPYKILHTLKYISESSKATDLKFCRRMHMNNFSKIDK